MIMASSDFDFDFDLGKMKDPDFRAKMMSKVNDLTKLATEKLKCDPACEFKKESEALKAKMDRAAKVKKNIPSIYSKRERAYYVFTKGEPYYDEMLEKRYEATGKHLLKAMTHKHTVQMQILREELRAYASGTLYEQNIRDLWKKYEREEKLYKLSNLKMQNNIAISDRQASYEDDETVKKTSTRNILMSIYYFIVFIFLVYLIAKKRYTEIKLVVIFVVLLIYPFAKTYALKSGMSVQNRVKAYFNDVYLDDDNSDDDDDYYAQNHPAIVS